MTALPAQFPQFRDLPIEIRLMIWTSLPVHTKIFVVDKPVPLDEDPNFRISVQLGPIAHVCREARESVRPSAQRPLADLLRRFEDQGIEQGIEEGRGEPITKSLAATLQPGWASPQWAFFDPEKDAVFLTPSALCHMSPQCTSALDKVVGPIRNVILSGVDMKLDSEVFDYLWAQVRLDCVHLVETTIRPGRAACSLLSDRLTANVPLVVSIEDLHSADVVESTLGADPDMLEQWDIARAYNSTEASRRIGYSWTEFRHMLHSDWLIRIAKRNPFADEANPPIDEDGLILNYGHPWIRKWNCSIPRFKSVVMFID